MRRDSDGRNSRSRRHLASIHGTGMSSDRSPGRREWEPATQLRLNRAPSYLLAGSLLLVADTRRARKVSRILLFGM